jgi:hypothetical protein
MRRSGLPACLVLLLTLALRAEATPFFARTYDFSCQTCHSGFPRLNRFGLAFKANNFRIPGAEKSAPLAWQKTIPLATQIVPTYQRFSPRPNVSQYTDTQLLAGGLLTRSTAFYIHHSLWIDDNPLEFPSYEVWGQQVLDERNKVLFKIGQFELPYSYSPVTHLSTVFGPLLFGAALQGNDVRIGSAMRGVQFSGLLYDKARWYVAYGAPALLASGNLVGHRQFFGEFRDLFVRLSNRDLARNVGLFFYLTEPPRNPNDPKTMDRGQRYGLDATLHWRGFQFYLMALYGEDRDPRGNGRRGFLRSGFFEVDKMLLPWLGMAARWDVQTTEINGNRAYADAKTISLRFYPVQNLKLVAEYQQRDHGVSGTALLATLSF